jgi:hypothetical protein
MSEIPTQLTEQQFMKHFDPCLSQAQRGFVGRIPRYKVFNYILYWLHTGCQWDEIPIEQQGSSKKKKSVGKPFMINSPNGVMTAVCSGCGKKAS